ncbi:c-type cytochrome [Modicisalibacter xianhensis]|uniref:Cytochrome C oxidase, cbb3-type, subunit III n=1 Tax=Modicisalibacter xianhensis TaxID=442341 RepID=A0A1I3FYT3_9GAMM|nr:cytochrome c [Halomonas xianhensis]SFI16355.1 Cytochrome C oxidase, cbb3-type, subunit III [Halomonas xianhensis]
MKSRTMFPQCRHGSVAAALTIALAGASLPVFGDSSKETVREPAEIYRQVCSHCHAPQYGVGPEITIAFPEAAWEARGNYIRMTVRNGRAAMPAFREAKISDSELNGLIRALVSGELDDAPIVKE